MELGMLVDIITTGALTGVVALLFFFMRKSFMNLDSNQTKLGERLEGQDKKIDSLGTKMEVANANYLNFSSNCGVNRETYDVRLKRHGDQIDDLIKITSKHAERIEGLSKNQERIDRKVFNGSGGK